MGRIGTSGILIATGKGKGLGLTAAFGGESLEDLAWEGDFQQYPVTFRGDGDRESRWVRVPVKYGSEEACVGLQLVLKDGQLSVRTKDMERIRKPGQKKVHWSCDLRARFAGQSFRIKDHRPTVTGRDREEAMGVQCREKGDLLLAVTVWDAKAPVQEDLQFACGCCS
jgi:hypothetical protein